MEENNSTSGVAWWIKPTSDTVSFFEGLPADHFSDGKNIIINQKYLQLNVTDVKGQALNIIIPIVEAAAGKKDWDEAVANGAGNVIQDLLAVTLLNLGATGLVVMGIASTTPQGWVIGGLALGMTWYSAYSGHSLGNIFGDAVKNGINPYSLEELLLDQHLTIPMSTSENVRLQDGSGNYFEYGLNASIANVQTNYAEQNWEAFLGNILDNSGASQLNNNGKLSDIRNLSKIELRNAIEHIDKVSFLLSHILIKVGEKIDIGNQGVYTVKSGNALSLIAQNYGMVTKELVALNHWLIDDNRIVFDHPTKVLIDAGTQLSSTTNHTLRGTSADDILKDHNGGNDRLVGGGGSDYLEGGAGNDHLYSHSANTFEDGVEDTLKGGVGDDFLYGADKDLLFGSLGYDTYTVHGSSFISDYDNSGQVIFMGNNLSGGTKIADNKYKGTYGEVYQIIRGNLEITLGSEKLTILNYNKNSNALGIYLLNEDDKTVEGSQMQINLGIDIFTCKAINNVDYSLHVKIKGMAL